MSPPVSRRTFIGAAGAFGAWVLSGCGGDDGSGASPGSTVSDPSTTTPSSTTGPSTTLHTARLPSDPFTLGIASGDPLADRVVLWTRLAPDPLAEDGLGAMPADPVDVVWEVAHADGSFSSPLRSGVATALPEDAHAIHVDVDGLDPATSYRYRFQVGEFTSPVGTTKTLADGSPSNFRLAVVNCQWLETGAYGAYRNLLAEDVDLVLHLGDYIYEYAGIEGPRMAQPGRPVVSLTDYRLRYASYKLDAELAAAHARFPFSLTWDDHEVANNYMGDVLPEDPSPAAARDRKAAAYRAWWEHQPVRFDPPDGSDLTIDRTITIGDLARIVVLDERQDSDPVPCRGEPTAVDDFGDCAARSEDRTRLGSAQEERAGEALAADGVTWNLLGNPVVLAGVDAGTDTSAYYLDTWDGFPAARLRLIEQLAASTNPVVLTGDYHAGMTLDVHATPFDQSTPVVAPEFMAPPISSPLFADPVRARTPQLRQQLNGHGYLMVDVAPDELTATFRILDDVSAVDSPIRDAAVWTVAPGDPVARQQR